MNTTDYDSMYPYTGGNQYSTKFWENFVYVTTHKYADFHGRASRGEYGRLMAVITPIWCIYYLLVMVLFNTDMSHPFLYGICIPIYILLMIPGWAVIVRRLHDINKSGWWLLIQLVLFILGVLGIKYNFMPENWWILTQFMSGILSLYLTYCTLRRGDAHANRFGPNPVPKGDDRYSTKIWKNFMYVIMYKYADFYGRASRGEFWRYMLVVFLIIVIPLLLMSIISGGATRGVVSIGIVISEIIIFLWILLLSVLIFPFFAVSARRLHDINKSGWWVLIYFIPVLNALGSLYLLYCNVRRGDPHANRFGPNPIPEEQQ